MANLNTAYIPPNTEVSDCLATIPKKKIILFGTGKYFDNYMICYGIDRRPYFAVDNDASKVGTTKRGISINPPESLEKLPKESFYVVICTAYRSPIEKQLETMGITDYQAYYPVPLEDDVRNKSLINNCKPYKIGYVPGAFDLFHIGHLNLLRNSKMKCEYLIAGVLTDELIEHFKGKKPVIPFAQRAAIVESIKYVDRVVPVDFSNTVKIDAWHKYHFDCHFSGNDHGADWTVDIKQLAEVGSKIEFFQYSGANSSTQIKKELEN